MNFTITIIVLLLFIYYINEINIRETLKDRINLNIFNGLSLLFVLLFTYYYIFFGLKKGLFTTFIIWCLFVIATPIPEAGLLVSVPLKNLLKIDLDKTQFVVSFIALGFIFYSYYYFRKYLSESKGGKFLLKIIDFGSFGIFITSIIASVSLSYLINEVIDSVLFEKEIKNTTNMIVFMLFLVPFILYFILLKQLPK